MRVSRDLIITCIQYSLRSIIYESILMLYYLCCRPILYVLSFVLSFRSFFIFCHVLFFVLYFLYSIFLDVLFSILYSHALFFLLYSTCSIHLCFVFTCAFLYARLSLVWSLYIMFYARIGSAVARAFGARACDAGSNPLADEQSLGQHIQVVRST